MRESQPCEGLGSLLTLGGSTPATREPVEGNSDFPISYKSPTFHREATIPHDPGRLLTSTTLFDHPNI